MRSDLPIVLSLAVAAVAGCSDGVALDAGLIPDAGPGPDAATMIDGGAPDAGRTPDASFPDAAAPDAQAPDAAPCPFTWCDDGAPLLSDTDADLDAFYGQRGARETFPTSYVDVVEALLRAEDEVVAGRYVQARARLDLLFSRYPFSDPVWWRGVGQAGANVGTPVAYYGLRMLDEIARVGVGDVVATSTSVRFVVVLAPCATGQRPTTPDLTTGEDVMRTLDPRVEADDYRVIRESLRLFQHYVWAITDGALKVELAIHRTETCAQVGFSPGADPSFGYATIEDYAAPIRELSSQQQDQADFYWVVYPSNVPEGPGFDDMSFIAGGMGRYAGRPAFISDDLWLVRNPAHLGEGPLSTVERRVYLPQWLKHEFFHHLFGVWSQFDLEVESHQWFDRTTWPNDFVGEWEPDYYAEALAKRLRGATPSLAQGLRLSRPPVDLSTVTAEQLVGRYTRRPVENGYHDVNVVLQDGQLAWQNQAGVRWQLFWSEQTLSTGEDCPYGAQALGVQASNTPGASPPRIDALVFLGESYVRTE